MEYIVPQKQIKALENVSYGTVLPIAVWNMVFRLLGHLWLSQLYPIVFVYTSQFVQ